MLLRWVPETLAYFLLADVTLGDSGLLFNIPVTPNLLSYICDAVQTEYKSIKTCTKCLLVWFVQCPHTVVKENQ
jgi:hypothetical protein